MHKHMASPSMILIGMAAAAMVLALPLCAVAASAADLASMGLPGCDTWCGDVRVPYPFGITPNCSYPAPGFHLTCDHTDGHRPRLLLGNGAFQVTEISLRDFSMRVVNRTGTVSISRGAGVWSTAGMLGHDGPFVLTPFRNELVVTGCDVQATLHGDNGTIVSGCSSLCFADGVEVYYNGSKICTGLGCCQAPVPVGRTSFDLRLRRLSANERKPVHVFIADADWFDKAGRDIIGFKNSWPMAMEVPVVLQFAIWPSKEERVKHKAAELHIYRDPKCYDAEAVKRICKSENSACENTDRGYACLCAHGYGGNAYLPNGCQDINECDLPQEESGCFGQCSNTIGSFKCRCARGTRGNHTIPHGCQPYVTGLTIGLSIASGSVFILLGLSAIFVVRMIKQHRIRRLRQKFFNQNRGQLLQQLVSHRSDIAERMMIPLQELEKATNKFDQSRKLGKGGHGTVYKGILSDLHVVAIKTPNKEIQREIDEFINEVAILSQINHRNIVRLLGCCLETPVPLLVYEFISNGTLHDHLHKATRGSLSWKDRLRIAKETSKAIAYLHSSVSIPIIHRDIKSSNILLDDALTAKVSDFGASRYIPLDQTGLTTVVQGTKGYMDPMYYSNGRLTEKSDVYSFGVILIELLTTKLPFRYVSPEGDGLVAHFGALHMEGNLDQILDPHVVKEGGGEIEQVAALAASCTKSSREERPTMRQVEMALEAFQAPHESGPENVMIGKSKEDTIANHMLARRRTNTEEVSRQYSLEEEIIMSARYP